MRFANTNSANLDLLRSFAVLLVVGFHFAKLFDRHPGTARVTDFGLLGVMLFFVHTTLVLMFSLERQRAGARGSMFMPFMIRRIFRIYPLAMVVVLCTWLLHIPSDLHFGHFELLRQSPSNLAANLLLVQNVTLQKANPGVLWSLPLELQMYLALPILFWFVTRAKSAWAPVAFWLLVAGVWYAIGYASRMLPLSEGGIRSPAEAFLKFTRFAPCFLPGLIAYKLWGRCRCAPALLWPAFLALVCTGFVLFAGPQPIQAGWLLCLMIGAGVALFREMPESAVTWMAGRIARYSYGIYLLHYFALWVGFVAFQRLSLPLRAGIFAAVLAGLSVLFYHAVEAPMIAAGVGLSRKLQKSIHEVRLGVASAGSTAQVGFE